MGLSNGLDPLQALYPFLTPSMKSSVAELELLLRGFYFLSSQESDSGGYCAIEVAERRPSRVNEQAGIGCERKRFVCVLDRDGAIIIRITEENWHLHVW